MEAIDPLYDFTGIYTRSINKFDKKHYWNWFKWRINYNDECYYTLSRTLLFDILNEQFNNVKEQKKKFIFDVMSELAHHIIYQNSICNILHSKCESDNLQWIIAQIIIIQNYDEFIEFMDRIL